jgi:hypothetical protein
MICHVAICLHCSKLEKCGTFRIGDRDFLLFLCDTRSIHCGTEDGR